MWRKVINHFILNRPNFYSIISYTSMCIDTDIYTYIEKLLFFQSFLFYEIDSFWQLKRSKFCWEFGTKLLWWHLVLSKSSGQLRKIFQVKNKFSLQDRSGIPRKQWWQDHTCLGYRRRETTGWMWTVKFWFENYFKNKQKKYSAYKHRDWAAFILDWIPTIEFTFFLIRFWVERLTNDFNPGEA